jgi:RING finger family protein
VPACCVVTPPPAGWKRTCTSGRLHCPSSSFALPCSRRTDTKRSRRAQGIERVDVAVFDLDLDHDRLQGVGPECRDDTMVVHATCEEGEREPSGSTVVTVGPGTDSSADGSGTGPRFEGHICAVCLDVMDAEREGSALTLTCGHTFHNTCINEWFDMGGASLLS